MINIKKIYNHKLCFFAACLLLTACGPDFSKVKEGDLIFNMDHINTSRFFSKNVCTPDPTCGIILKNGKSLEVFAMDSVAHFITIKEWMSNCEDVTVKRLKNSEGILTTPILKKIYKTIHLFENKKNDAALSWNDSAFYNSELIWKIYQRSTGLQMGEPVSYKSLNKQNDGWSEVEMLRKKLKIKDKEEIITPDAILNSEYLYSVIGD